MSLDIEPESKFSDGRHRNILPPGMPLRRDHQPWEGGSSETKIQSRGTCSDTGWPKRTPSSSPCWHVAATINKMRRERTRDSHQLWPMAKTSKAASWSMISKRSLASAVEAYAPTFAGLSDPPWPKESGRIKPYPFARKYASWLYQHLANAGNPWTNSKVGLPTYAGEE